MRAVVVVLVVGAVLLFLWYQGQGDTTTVPDAPNAPDIPLPDNPDDVAEGTENLLNKIPSWGWSVVGVLLIVAVIASIKRKNPVLFWAVIFITVGVVIGQAFVK